MPIYIVVEEKQSHSSKINIATCNRVYPATPIYEQIIVKCNSTGGGLMGTMKTQAEMRHWL